MYVQWPLEPMRSMPPVHHDTPTLPLRMCKLAHRKDLRSLRAFGSLHSIWSSLRLSTDGILYLHHVVQDARLLVLSVLVRYQYCQYWY
eukprot:jgi/Botrbrau1/7013/Bobra.0165s0042.1